MSREGLKVDQALTPDFTLHSEIKKRHEYSENEVGITHPDNNSFIRLNDRGDIEIFAAPGVGIIISGASRTITLHADSIRLQTKQDGFRWNNYAFNYSATTYIEPCLVRLNMDKVHPAVGNIDYYLDNARNLEQQHGSDSVTILGSYMFDDAVDTPAPGSGAEVYRLNLSNEQVEMLNAYAESHSQEQVDKVKALMGAGNSFTEAREKVNRGIY